MGEIINRETEQQLSRGEEYGGFEQLGNDLLQEGFEGKDVEAVTTMAKDISGLNKLIFGDSIPFVYVDEDKSGKRRMASYREPNKDDGLNEGYYIFMRGIADNANFSMQNSKLWFDSDGKIKIGEMEQGGTALTFDEFMFGLAAHEVRHRVQQKPDFKKIDMAKDMENDYKNRDSEKDARIIGYKAVKALHSDKTMDEIAKIIGKVD